MSESLTPLDPRRWRALSVLLLGQFAALLDVSVTNIALPSIARSTGADASELQWIASGYILAIAVMPIIGGRLGDLRGRRNMFIIGLAGFVIASAVVGLSPTPGTMIVARVVQGLFGGVLGPQVSGFLQNAFAPQERGRAFGLLGLTVAIATAFGPILGGLLIALGGEDFGWRLVFFINVPIGIVAIVLSLLWVRESRSIRATSAHGLDIGGAVLLGVAILTLLFPIVEFSSFRSPLIFCLLAPSAVLFVVFFRREGALTRRNSGPLLDLSLLRHRSFTIGVGFIVLYFCGSSGLPLVVTLYLQQGLGFGALQAALAITALAVGTAISSTVAGRLVNRFGRMVVVAGMSVFIVGAAAVAVVVGTGQNITDPVTVIARLAIPVFLVGFGGGAVISPNQALSLAEVNPVMGGAAGGMLQTAQRVGAAIGQSAIGAVFFAVLGSSAASSSIGRAASVPGDFAISLIAGIGAALVFSIAALVFGFADVRATARRARADGGALG